jgi:hypothetical protein
LRGLAPTSPSPATRCCSTPPAHHYARQDASDEPWIDLHDYIEQVAATEDYSVSRDGQSNIRYAPEGFRVL